MKQFQAMLPKGVSPSTEHDTSAIVDASTTVVTQAESSEVIDLTKGTLSPDSHSAFDGELPTGFSNQCLSA